MDSASGAEALFQETVQLIQINFCPTSSNDSRQAAIQRLNSLMQFDEAYHCLERSLELAQLLIQQTAPNSDPLIEYSVYYGLQLLTHIVRLKWQSLPLGSREGIGQFCVQCCRTSTVQKPDGSSVKLAIHSPLVLNSVTQLVWELFCRTYPSQWETFVPDVVQNYSILGPAIFLNLSEMINDLILPKNPSRRKEIIACLHNEKAAIFSYFSGILCSYSPTSVSITLKTIQTLESIFQWFALDEPTIKILLEFTYQRFQEISYDFQGGRQVQNNSSNSSSIDLLQASYQCILSILKRQNVNRLDDIITLQNLFYTLTSASFTSYLIDQALSGYLSNSNIDSDPILEKLFILFVDILVEILTHCLELYNRKLDNESTAEALTGNQALWGRWTVFVPVLLAKNNPLLDEILLKFLLMYGKLRIKPEVNESTETQTGSAEDETCYLYTPIKSDVHEEFMMNILKKIILYKNEPESEEVVREKELSNSYFDDYESYQDLFRLNRVKFISFMIAVCENQSSIGKDYIMNLMGYMLGPVTTFDKSEVIPNWNCFVFMIQTMLPRLDFEQERIGILEWHFQKLLEESTAETHDIDTLTNIISCLSAMSTLYRHFCPTLIKFLLERIFDFALKPEGKFSRHAQNLFIRLSLERAPILVEHFDTLCKHSDELFESNKISHAQYFSLIEGLVILSNHFKEPARQLQYIGLVLQKINWIRSYDFGVNGINFCRDANLNSLPAFRQRETIQNDILNEVFLNFKGALRLLTIIFKRLNPKVCSAPEMLQLFDFVVPFFRIVTFLNYYWKLWKDGNADELKKYVCQEYFVPFFEEMPYKMYANILQDRKFLFHDRNTLLKLCDKWAINKNSEVAYFEMFSWYLTCKFQSFYTDIMTLSSSVFNYLFVFQQNLPPDQKCFAENFIKNCVSELGTDSLKHLPLIYSYDSLLLLLNFTTLLPREAVLLNFPEIVDFVNDHLLMLFERLHPWFDGQKPDMGNDHVLEIIVEGLYTIFSGKFVSILFVCQSPDSGLYNWMQKFDKHSEIEEIDRDDLVEAMKDCNIITGPGSSSANKCSGNAPNDKEPEMRNTLLNSMICKNWQVAEMILKLLKWPFQREKICSINQHMVKCVFHQGILNSVDKITCIFTNILEAISITETSESAVLNQLVKLFATLYEKVALSGYSMPFNIQLSGLTGIDVHEWNRYASSLGNESVKAETSRLKNLRRLLESLCRKPISESHMIEKPNINALFRGGVRRNKDSVVLDIDSSIAALFE